MLRVLQYKHVSYLGHGLGHRVALSVHSKWFSGLGIELLKRVRRRRNAMVRLYRRMYRLGHSPGGSDQRLVFSAERTPHLHGAVYISRAQKQTKQRSILQTFTAASR